MSIALQWIIDHGPAISGYALLFLSEWMGSHPGSKYDAIFQVLAAILKSVKTKKPTEEG